MTAATTAALAAPSPTPLAPDPAVQAVLNQLHPLALPAPPAWTPQTVGWSVLSATGVLLGLWLLWRGWQHWLTGRFRRTALAELRQLRQQLGDPSERLQAARQLPVLVRRLALAHAKRSSVAALHGQDWLAWLDATLADPKRPFSQRCGRSLSDWAYLPASSLPWEQLEPLCQLLEHWIRKHQVPGPDAAGGPA